jgi:hypothetical protein
MRRDPKLTIAGTGTPASFWCAEAGNYRIARGIDLRDKLVRTAYWPLTRPIVSGR